MATPVVSAIWRGRVGTCGLCCRPGHSEEDRRETCHCHRHLAEMNNNVSARSSSVATATVLTIPFVFSSFFFFFIISSWTAVGHCQELVHGKVQTEISATSNSSTGPSESLFPSSLKVNVKLGGRHVHLQLTRDTGFKPQLPVYVLSTDSLGALQSRRARLRDTEFAVFQDIQNEGAFGVFREKDTNGTTHYKLQGFVHSEGVVYNLRSLHQAESTTHRFRRNAAAAAADTEGDQNGHNNSSESQGQKEEEEEEVKEEEDEHEVFEVNAFPDQAAVDGAESVSAPGSPDDARRRVLRKEEPLVVVPIPSAHPLSVSPAALPLPAHVVRRKRRGRRQATQQVYVDVVAVADFGVYKAWYDRSSGVTSQEKQQNTLQELRQYYAIVMNGVDLLYKTITSVSYSINVRLVGIFVSTTTGAAQWTEQYRRSGARWDTVDSKSALEAFRSWAAGADVLPAYDHLMLFSGYDLTKNINGNPSTGITGLAYTSTACQAEGRAVSIVEDLGGFQCIVTAAHELGHGLSAEHDGTGNACRSEDRYIMSVGTYNSTPANKLNPWRFSSCSINYFTTFIRNAALTARGQQCLYNALTADVDVPDVTSLVPGQIYDPDTQCRQVYGPESRYCRGSEFGLVADLCTDMYCYDPSTASTCIRMVAARGTTCGSQKWCQSGQCVADAAAPVVDDTCAFGDQPGAAFDGDDCPTFVNGHPGYCYQQVVRTRCCASCARHFQTVIGCEYGDKAKGCSSNYCSSYKQEAKETCCGSCNYGTTYTTTPASTVFPWPTGPACADNPTFTFNEMTCPSIAARQPESCYDVTVRSQCCSSCRAVSTGIPGCEYGDRDPARCTEAQTNPEACSTLSSVCCRTCAGYDSSKASVVVITRGLSSRLLASVVTVLFVTLTL